MSRESRYSSHIYFASCTKVVSRIARTDSVRQAMLYRKRERELFIIFSWPSCSTRATLPYHKNGWQYSPHPLHYLDLFRALLQSWGFSYVCSLILLNICFACKDWSFRQTREQRNSMQGQDEVNSRVKLMKLWATIRYLSAHTPVSSSYSLDSFAYVVHT
jgi:hypothetical protein